MIKILFVCLGNICRSPLAEAVFAKKVKELGLENKLRGDSAGTAGYHIGDDPDPRTIGVARKHQVPVSHKGRKFSNTDGRDFEYLLAMDASNLRDMIHELGYKHEGLYLMRDFDPQQKGANVPDPYYGDERDFEEVYDILDRSMDRFLKFLIEKHALK